MSFVRIASAFLLLLAIHGFRVKISKGNAPDDEVNPGNDRTNSPNEFPASAACLLASGFGLQRGCQYPQAMQPVPDCDAASFDQTCYKVFNAENVRGYTRDVRSTRDYSSLTRSVTEAEGGGYGVSVSASFSYMKRSQVSEKSLSFFIGSSGRTQTRSIQNPVAMKLTSAAKDLLQQSPREFITRHGLRYIQSITYGGSFLGSVTLNSRQTADDRDIQAFADFSVNKGLFSASGSQDFQDTLARNGRNISVFINAQWVGGSRIEQDYQTPATLSNMFQDWDNSWRTNPAPITLITRRWSDSEDVQEVINSMSDEDRELFNSPDISQEFSRMISEESAKVALSDSSVTKALAWNEIQADQVVMSCLTALRRDVQNKVIRIDLLDEADVLMIQQQALSGDYSWFQAESFNDRYVACVEGVQVTEPPTPAPTPAPREKTCTRTKRNVCTGHPIDWYQPKCSIHGAGYRRIGWEHCSAVFGGRYICRKTWTCTQQFGAEDCCRME